MKIRGEGTSRKVLEVFRKNISANVDRRNERLHGF